ncbi:hypothetical protein [Cytobacillus oceanisediminis]|nr:hypothetical protein [Cytobacillus oceanisediminis]
MVEVGEWVNESVELSVGSVVYKVGVVVEWGVNGEVIELRVVVFLWEVVF